MLTWKLSYSHIGQSHFAILQRWRLLVTAILAGVLLLFVTPTASASSSPACPGQSYVEIPFPTPAPAAGDGVTYHVTGLTEGTTPLK